jgi:hypothetical protein
VRVPPSQSANEASSTSGPHLSSVIFARAAMDADAREGLRRGERRARDLNLNAKRARAGRARHFRARR